MAFTRVGRIRRMGATAVAATSVIAATVVSTAATASAVPPDPHAQFQAVSCPTTSFCMAVGTHYATDKTYQSFAETSDGTSWSVVTTGLRGTGAQSLIAVSCLSSTFCVATPSATRGQVFTWNGSTWTAATLPGGVGYLMQAVKCRTATNCMVLGNSRTTTASWHRDSTGWHKVAVPYPTKTDLSSLSCPATNVCYAGGGAVIGINTLRPYVQRWNGSTWTSSKIPSLKDASVGDISCPTATRCTVVGDTGGHLLLGDLSAGRWHYTASPAKYQDGVHLSCTGAGTCTWLDRTIVPDDETGYSVSVRSPSGTIANATTTYSDLRGLSCSASSCIVVGSDLISDPSGNTIADVPTQAKAYKRTGTGTALAEQEVAQP